MGPAGYGQLALGLTIAGIFTTYVYGPLANVVSRFFSVYRERGELNLYFVVLKRFHFVLAAAQALIACIIAVVTAFLVGSSWAYVVIVASLFGIVSGINASYISLQSAIRQRKIVALHQGFDVWLRIGLAILFVLLCGINGYCALWGYLLGTLAITMSQSFYARKNPEINLYWADDSPSKTATKECSAEFLQFALSFVAFAGFAVISLYSDRWVIQWVLEESAVGVYSAIYQIAASPVNLLFSIINQLMVPIIFERAGSLSTKEQQKASSTLVHKTVALSGIASIIIVFAMYLFSEPLVTILTNRSFSASHGILWITVLGLALYNIAQLLALKGIYNNTPNIYLWPKGVQALSFLFLAFMFARQMGIMGVSMALCLSSVVYLIMVLIVNRRIIYVLS
jgi:O-antigen/teichoic acid export membrane protein